MLKDSFIAVALVAGTLSAQAATSPRVALVDGFVGDTLLAPLGSADVTVLGTSLRVATGANGRFQIRNLASGNYLLIVRRIGFRPTSAVIGVHEGDTLRLSYALEPAAATLPGVVVEETRLTLTEVEFLARKRAGLGQFITAEDIERHNPVYATDLLRPVLAVDVKAKDFGHVAYSRRSDGGFTSSCPMRVLLDEVPLPRPVDLDLLPPPHLISGIEIYSGAATAPLRYSGLGSGCGLILIWTKTGS